MNEKMYDIEIGDMIKWTDYTPPYYVINREHYFNPPKYGIVVEVYIPKTKEMLYDTTWDLAGGYGGPFMWDCDVAWIKVLTIGEQYTKRYIYLEYERKIEVISKMKKDVQV